MLRNGLLAFWATDQLENSATYSSIYGGGNREKKLVTTRARPATKGSKLGL